jgi:iron complex transport system ATP-binding protein
MSETIVRRTVKRVAVEGVRFSYGERAVLRGVSFEAGAGDLVFIVGPNGCGKSTLLRVLVGELKASAGRWVMDDVEVGGLARVEAARMVSLVPQMAAAPFGYTVREMVLMARHAAGAGFAPFGFETAEDLQLANEAMWAADVHHLAERRVNELSGGERQRAAIARAFTQDTPVMLLDEPTSNLDLFHQLELLEQLRKMTREAGRIGVMVTHDLNMAMEHATRVVLMDDGAVVAVGRPEEVLTAEKLEPVYRVKVVQGGNAGLKFVRGMA